MKKLLLGILASAMLLMCACGSSKNDLKPSKNPFDDTNIDTVSKAEKTLEDVFAKSSNYRKQLDETMESFLNDATITATFSDISWDVNGNILTYYYTYTSASKAGVDEDGLDAQVPAVVKQAAKEYGVDDLAYQYIYMLPDGTVYFDKTYWLDGTSYGGLVAEDAIDDLFDDLYDDFDDDLDYDFDDDLDDDYNNNSGALTIEDMMNLEPTAKAQVDQAIADMLATPGMDQVYSDMTWEVHGNTVTYITTLAYGAVVDSVALAETMDAQTPSVVAQAEAQYGISDITYRYVYLTYEGDVIFDKSYTSK